MGSHSDVTCHPTQVNTPRLNLEPDRRVLDLPTPRGWKTYNAESNGHVIDDVTRAYDVSVVA